MNQMVRVSHILSACISLSDSAGDIIRTVMSSGQLHTTDKGAGQGGKVEDPQTIADLKAQKLIMGSLSKQWPNLRLVGEEGELEVDPADCVEPSLSIVDSKVGKDGFSGVQDEVPMEQVVVWIDPLDGTKEFTEGIKSAVTTLIGISVRDSPIAGVIHQPFSGDKGHTIWGYIGVGSFGFQHPDHPPFPERRVVAVSRSHFSPATQACMEKIQPTGDIRQGGAGSKVVLLLEGHADAWVHPGKGTKRWDTCAPEAVLRAAGGCLTDQHGQPYRYVADEDHGNHVGVIASWRGHDTLLNMIREANL